MTLVRVSNHYAMHFKQIQHFHLDSHFYTYSVKNHPVINTLYSSRDTVVHSTDSYLSE